MFKKLFSRLTALVCAAALMLTSLPLPVAAEEEETPAPLITVDSVSAAQGRNCTVYVRAQNLVELLGLSLVVEYDSSVLTLTGSGVMNMQGGVNTNEAGRAQMTAMAEGSISGAKTLLYLTFRVADTAELGTYPLSLSILQAFNASLTEIALEKASGSVTVTKAEIPEATFYLYGDSSVTAGEQLKLRLWSYDLEGMAAGQFSFSYDSTLLRFERVSLLDAMNVQDATLAVNSQNEGLAVAAYAAAVSASTGYLLEIVFTALEDAAGSATVTCQPASLYSSEKTVIQATAVSKTITIQPAEEEVVLPAFRLEGAETLLTNGTVTLTAVIEGSSALAAADFTLSYDAALLNCVAVEKVTDSDEELSDGINVFVNPSYGEGKIAFSLFAPNGISEDTALVTIQLKAAVNQAKTTTITAKVTKPVNSNAEAVMLMPQSKTLVLEVPSFSVTFLDHDGAVLKIQQVAYLSSAEAPETAGKEPEETQHYLHTGWDQDFTSVTENLTVTAVYEREAHHFSDSVWQCLDNDRHVRTCSGCTVKETASHNWDNGKETTSPGCTTTGVMTFTCNDCSASRTEDIAPLDHAWNAGEVTTPATCTEAGVLTKNCIRCDKTKTEVIAALGHSEKEPVQENLFNATCTADGSYDEVIYCTVCDAEISRTDKAIPKLGHTPKASVEEDHAEPSCTVDGGYDTVVYCATCGEELSREHTVLDALGHAYAEEYTVDKAATCTEEGSKSRHCSRCNDKTEVTVIESLNHAWDDGVVTIPATCTEAGVLTKTCSRCDKTKTETIAALGHSEKEPVQENLLNATCTATGSYDLVVYCQRCGAVLQSTHHTIEKLAHTEGEPVQENYLAETCAVNGGYDTVVYCKVCDGELSREHTVLTALGHDYADEFTVDKAATCTEEGSKSHHCSRCDDKTNVTVIEILNHAWDDGVLTKAATCTVDGTLTKTCSRCQKTQTEIIPATGHTAGTVVRENEVAATCTADGSYDEVIYCTVCGAEVSRTDKAIPKLGHTPKASVEENRAEPSCTIDGGYDTVVYCKVCSAELSREHTVLTALGHDYADVFTVDKAATCTEEGSKSRHCSRCNDKTNVTAIESLNHDWDDGVVTEAATCTVDGTLTKTCSRCQKTQKEIIPATGHTAGTAVRENEVAATCTANGSYEEVVRCTVCTTELSRTPKMIPILEHIPDAGTEENRKEPTCTAEGSYDTVVRCKVCQKELRRTTTMLENLEHDYAEDFTIDQEPTCTAVGSKSRHCSRCDSKTEVIELVALGHALDEGIVTTEPTCTEDGVRTRTCSRCGEKKDEVIIAGGHTYGAAVRENEILASCSAAGSYDSVIYCTVCQVELSRITKVIEMLVHTPGEPTEENRQAPTCTVDGGYDMVTRCTVCNAVVGEEHTVLNKLGHTYQAPAFSWSEDLTSCTAVFTCDICEDGTENKVLQLACSISEEETGSATCTVEGQITVTAMAVLGENIYTDQMSRSVPKTDHDIGEWLPGNVEYHSGVCTMCGETETLSHEWEGHACPTCGQKDAYFVASGGTVTIFAAKIEKDTRVLIAGYTESGQMVSCMETKWGDAGFVKVELPDSEKVSGVQVYFLDANWNPLRASISQ